jgi:hypothetical protein
MLQTQGFISHREPCNSYPRQSTFCNSVLELQPYGAALFITGAFIFSAIPVQYKLKDRSLSRRIIIFP